MPKKHSWLPVLFGFFFLNSSPAAPVFSSIISLPPKVLESEYAAHYLRAARASEDAEGKFSHLELTLLFVKKFKQTSVAFSALDFLVTESQLQSNKQRFDDLVLRYFEYFKQQSQNPVLAKKLLALADRLHEEKHHTVALVFYQYFIPRFSDSSTSRYYLQMVNNLAEIYVIEEQPAMAEKYFTLLLKNLQREAQTDPSLRINALRNLAQLAQRKGDLWLALRRIHEALLIANSRKNRKLEIELLNSKGEVLSRWRLYNAALDAQQKALDLGTQYAEPLWRAEKLETIAELQLAIGFAEVAIQTLFQALEIRIKHNLPRAKVFNLTAKANIFNDQFERAQENLDSARREMGTVGERISSDLDNQVLQAKLHLMRKEYEEAQKVLIGLASNTAMSLYPATKREFLNVALAVSQAINDRNSELLYHQQLAEHFRQLEYAQYPKLSINLENAFKRSTLPLPNNDVRNETGPGKTTTMDTEKVGFSLAVLIVALLCIIFIVSILAFVWRGQRKRSMRKIGDLEKVIENIQQHQATDPLLRVFNKHLMETFLEREADISLTYDSNFCVLVVDIDGFTQINTIYGHQIGDKVLTSLIKTINNTKRPEDYFGRWIGADFMYIMHKAELKEAVNFAEVLKHSIGKNEIQDDSLPDTKAIKVSVSIGISTFQDSKYNVKECAVKALNALREGKAFASDNISTTSFDKSLK